MRHIRQHAIHQAGSEERGGYVMATVQQQVPDAAVIKGHRSLRDAGAGWLVLNGEDAAPVAAGDGFSDGAVGPQHRVGVQAQEPRLACVPGQGLDAVTAD